MARGQLAWEPLLTLSPETVIRLLTNRSLDSAYSAAPPKNQKPSHKNTLTCWPSMIPTMPVPFPQNSGSPEPTILNSKALDEFATLGANKQR